MTERTHTQAHWSSENQIGMRSRNPSRKLLINKRVHDIPRLDNVSSLSMATSTFKGNSMTEHEFGGVRAEEIENLNMAYFTQKYLPRNAPHDDVDDEIRMVLSRKQNQLASQRIYRDELKLISLARTKKEHIKLSIQSLKKKAEVEERISQTQVLVEKEVKSLERELQFMNQYQSFMNNCLENKNYRNSEMLDMGHEEEVMVNNLVMETAHLMNELADEQRRNTRDIRQIQDQITELRVSIQQKEDLLRELKARICTMYIKLHSRASSRNGSKSKDRNLSLSVKKFNSQSHNLIKEAYVGNNAFKSYSKELIEKVTADEELVKIRFYISEEAKNLNPKLRDQFFFQCFYRTREGIIHKETVPREQGAVVGNNIDNDVTRDKISDTSHHCEQILVKYLFSMKFFYKSKIVGVECRVKTDKGNRHIQIGNCDPSIQHELLTLVNKKLVTIGSFWHGKEMIGISVWYSDKQKKNLGNNLKASSSSSKSIRGLHRLNHNSSKDKLQSYDQYYV